MRLSRRKFLTQAATAIPAALCARSFAKAVSSEIKVRIKLDPTHTVAVIPADFTGLGYEISSVARQGLLSSRNSEYVQLVRTLGRQGVIRVGGNTADYASYSATGQPLSSPETKAGSVVNQGVLRDLGTFLDATGWQLIWGLNLGNGTPENAIEEAKAVTAAAGNHLIAFEIGNEPDLFSRHEVHRHSGYNYDSYIREYRAYRDALRKSVPNIPFAGPDAAVATDWVERFASDEGKDVKLLAHHYYREGQNPSSTTEKLLHTDPKLAPILARLKAASESSRVPYRICETNSFSGGGKPGVSDTFASALWVLDFMFTLASAGCAGVNIETGVNQLGFISSYSPIGDDEHGHYWAAPEYYGMLAFAQSGVGRLVQCALDAGDRNITGYATRPADDYIALTIINKESASDAKIVVDTGDFSRIRSGSVCRLSAQALESKSGVTLGGAPVSRTGFWKPAHLESLAKSGSNLEVQVPAASAAIVTLYA